MKKKTVSLILVLALCLGIIPTAFAADAQPVSSNNKNAQDYTTYGATVKSYLYENPSGGLTRVEYISNQVVIEDYDSSFRFQSGRTISPELPIWGGFYAGSQYNFLIFGQNNASENNNTEVIRVVKYDKNWNRLGQASLKGANTVSPFDAGSLRCDEYGGYLYIRTCHKMYQSSDGLNHQANLTMAVKQSDMTITDSYYNVMNQSYGYVSHSFNQFIIVDESGRIVALDHGDAYPRGVAFTKYYADAGTGIFRGSGYGAWCSYGTLCDFAGSVGQNTTGASIGGLAETTSCYIFSYNYDGVGGSGARYPIFHYMDKATGKSWRVTINLPGSTTPILAPTGLDGGYMLWNGKSGSTVNDTLYYLHYGADGKPEQYQTATASLSGCQPIYYNGKVVWYTTSNSVPTFYTLDSSGVTAKEAQAPTPPSFSDVKSSDYFANAVQWAVSSNVTTGTTAAKFSPSQTCTAAQILTFLWRAAGEPKSSAQLPIALPASLSYADGAIRWAAEKGMVGSAFDPNAPCTRASAVTYIWQAFGSPPAGSSGFSDVPASAGYSQAVAWAVGLGITDGVGGGRFSPDAVCSRGQIVTFLHRAYVPEARLATR